MPGLSIKLIDEDIIREAKELITYLKMYDGGKVTKGPWKTAFGTIYDRVNKGASPQLREAE